MNLKELKNLKLISDDIELPNIDDEKIDLNTITIDSKHSVFKEICKHFPLPKKGEEIKLIIITTPKEE
jgi:hypothetical protein